MDSFFEHGGMDNNIFRNLDAEFRQRLDLIEAYHSCFRQTKIDMLLFNFYPL